jgi:hypothetical protein
MVNNTPGFYQGQKAYIGYRPFGPGGKSMFNIRVYIHLITMETQIMKLRLLLCTLALATFNSYSFGLSMPEVPPTKPEIAKLQAQDEQADLSIMFDIYNTDFNGQRAKIDFFPMPDRFMGTGVTFYRNEQGEIKYLETPLALIPTGSRTIYLYVGKYPDIRSNMMIICHQLNSNKLRCLRTGSNERVHINVTVRNSESENMRTIEVISYNYKGMSERDDENIKDDIIMMSYGRVAFLPINK